MVRVVYVFLSFHSPFLSSRKFFVYFFRVEQYIEAGKDKNIVDPDPSGLYTKRKQQRSSKDVSQSQDEETTSSVTYPIDGWGTSLSRLPVFTRGEMNEYIARSGKNIGNKDHHSVPTTLRKEDHVYYGWSRSICRPIYRRTIGR